MMKKKLELTPEQEAAFDHGFDVIVNTFTKALKYAKVINKRNKKLLMQNHQMIGKIINCHLLIERLILKELVELKKHDPKIRTGSDLSFNRKYNQLPTNKPYSFLLPAIRELNKIRNTLAHNLDDIYDLSALETKQIKKVLYGMHIKDVKTLSVEGLVEILTERAMILFAFRDPQVKAVFAAVKKENPNFTLLDYFK